MKITAETLKKFQMIEEKVKLLGEDVQELIETAECSFGESVKVIMKNTASSKNIVFSEKLKLTSIEQNYDDYIRLDFERSIAVYIDKKFMNSIIFR